MNDDFTCDLCGITKPAFQRYPDEGTDYAPDGTPLFTWKNATTEGWCWECNEGGPRQPGMEAGGWPLAGGFDTDELDRIVEAALLLPVGVI